MLVALRVKVDVPAAALPLIVPVAVFRLSPGGKLPATIDHVIGPPPLALAVKL